MRANTAVDIPALVAVETQDLQARRITRPTQVAIVHGCGGATGVQRQAFSITTAVDMVESQEAQDVLTAARATRRVSSIVTEQVHFQLEPRAPLVLSGLLGIALKKGSRRCPLARSSGFDVLVRHTALYHARQMCPREED